MSQMQMRGNHVFQSVGENEDELGYISYDKHSKKFVLWGKDFNGDFIGNPGRYVRAGEWDTIDEARLKAMSSPAAFLLHLKWMNSLERSFGFLAMQFGDRQLDMIAREHIKPVVKQSLGLEVIDVRDIQQAGLIDDLIRKSIAKAKFVIADLTHGNNGAYWEAGFAEGSGIPVVYICEERVFAQNSTHFDTNHLTTVMWSLDRLKEFEEDLVTAIGNTLKRKG